MKYRLRSRIRPGIAEPYINKIFDRISRSGHADKRVRYRPGYLQRVYWGDGWQDLGKSKLAEGSIFGFTLAIPADIFVL